MNKWHLTGCIICLFWYFWETVQYFWYSRNVIQTLEAKWGVWGSWGFNLVKLAQGFFLISLNEQAIWGSWTREILSLIKLCTVPESSHAVIYFLILQALYQSHIFCCGCKRSSWGMSGISPHVFLTKYKEEDVGKLAEIGSEILLTRDIVAHWSAEQFWPEVPIIEFSRYCQAFDAFLSGILACLFTCLLESQLSHLWITPAMHYSTICTSSLHSPKLLPLLNSA